MKFWIFFAVVNVVLVAFMIQRSNKASNTSGEDAMSSTLSASVFLVAGVLFTIISIAIHLIFF